MGHRRTGKLIIASQHTDISQLEKITRHAEANQVPLEALSQAQCRVKEPKVRAIAGLYSASTGIIDSHQYMNTLLTLAQQQGMLYSPLSEFNNAEKRQHDFKVSINTCDGMFQFYCQNLINSAGLDAQQVAHHIDALEPGHIPPLYYVRGHYFNYRGKAPFHHLVYPIPPTHHQGLGIHATLDLSGQLRFGPDVQYIERCDYQFPDNRQAAFVDAIQHYFPTLDPQQLSPTYTGIRPKLSAPHEAPHDFMIQDRPVHGVDGLINLFGIESPGLTASLALADEVIERLQRHSSNSNKIKRGKC